MKRNKKSKLNLWIPLIIIFTIIGITVFQIKVPKISYKDLEILNFEWECLEGQCKEPPLVYLHDQLKGRGDLVLYSYVDSPLYVKIWVNDKLSDTTQDSPRSVWGGERKIHLWNIPLSSLNDILKIEVCFSYKEEFNKYSKDVICKEKVFSLPKISVDISPEIVEFSVSKSNWWDTQRQNITIRNTGEVPINIAVFLPSYVSERLNYPTYYPQYMTVGFVGLPSRLREIYENPIGLISVTLLPGESAKYDIAVSIGNVGEFDTPLGTYTSTGYIFSLYYDNFDEAQFKKEFTIRTRVTE